MGLMFRRARPIARLAAGAATAGVAYHAGKRAVQQDEYDQQASAAYAATMQQPAPPPQYVPAPPAPAGPVAPAPAMAQDPVAALGKLAELHQAGQLTDEEFAAAKSRLLGM